MYRIAVCDDDAIFLQREEQRIRQELDELGMECNIETFTEVSSLMDNLNSGTKYHLFFLDIEMPSMDGITFSRTMELHRSDALVVIVSGFDELVFQAFEARPFRYVRKTSFEDEIKRVVQDGIRELAFLTENRQVQFTCENGDITMFQIEDIIYVEAFGKYCTFVLQKERVSLRIRFQEAERKLQSSGFLKPHRSYLVNARYIYTVRREEVLLDQGIHIPLSRLKAKEIRSRFLDYLAR